MDSGRRRLIGGVVASLGAGLVAKQAWAAAVPCPATGLRVEGGSASQDVNCAPVGGLLTPADFSYVGYLDVQTDGLDSPYSRGLTTRRVNGELRLLYLHNSGRWIVEASLAGKVLASSGSGEQNQLTSVVRRWKLPDSVRWHQRKQIMWDEAAGRLWFISSIDYPSDTDDVSTNIYTMTLVDNGLNGTVSNVKRISLQDVPDRRAGTGMLQVPASFQQRWNVPPYVVGLGSYQSRMGQRGEAAMGPSMYAIPDPAPLADGAVLPPSQYRVLASRGNVPRGRRASLPDNQYDAYKSPGPDGLGYWTWDDGYYGGLFIDGPTKKGIVLVGVFMTGKTFYQESRTNAEGYVCEAHILDPEQAGLASRGGRSTVLDPTSMRVLEETRRNGLVNAPNAGVGYDITGKRLYVMTYGTGPNGYWNRVHVYGVNA
jgi:hypothetical protein